MLKHLLDLPGVATAVDSAREACTQLRWHEALRRRIPEAAAESRVRGAHASAVLSGVELSVDEVRARVLGLDARDSADFVKGGSAESSAAGNSATGLERSRTDDAVWGHADAAIRVTMETERLQGLVLTAPAQALTALHVAAKSGGLGDDDLGQMRSSGQVAQELSELGEAPEPVVAQQRMRELRELLVQGSAQGVPGVLLAAVAHAEVAVVRPFVAGNALVARAMERMILVASGVDPTAVSVPEAGHGHGGLAPYVGSLVAYSEGGVPGLTMWLTAAAQAVERGALQGRDIADAVLLGRTH